MGRVTNTIFIHRPITGVFDLATTARTWPRWHASSLRVSGAVDHPVEVGERISDEVRIAGRTGVVEWTCVERDRPRRIVLVSAGTQGEQARLVYTLVEHDGGTTLTRTLTYRYPIPLAGLLEPLLITPLMRRDARTALDNLKALIEAEIPPSGVGG
jgi:uncharacterized protein YndB with AHSA1/START domain